MKEKTRTRRRNEENLEREGIVAILKYYNLEKMFGFESKSAVMVFLMCVIRSNFINQAQS